MTIAQHPAVSLISPIYNGGEHYSTCYESLLNLNYLDGQLQILVIDDCSTDGTREYLANQSPPEHLRIIFPEHNLGRSNVRNHALTFATGEIIIFLDGDMEVSLDFVTKHVEELQKPNRKAVIGHVDPADWLPRTKLFRYLYDYGRRGAKQFGPDKPVGFQYVLTNNFSLWRDALDAGGPFPAEFHHYGGEDTIFGYRLARQFPNGLYYRPEARSTHHHDRQLKNYLASLADYGSYNLPQIMEEHPEIATPLAADYAWHLPGKYFRRKRLIGLWLFNTFTIHLAKAVLALSPRIIGGPLVRFLIVATVVQNLRLHIRRKNRRQGAHKKR